MSQDQSSSRPLAEDRVHLHAERIDAELEGAALVVERVDHEADVSSWIACQFVAVREMGADVAPAPDRARGTRCRGCARRR